MNHKPWKVKAIIVSMAFLTTLTYSDQLLDLAVSISKDYLETWGIGGSLPKLFYKEEGANLLVLHKEPRSVYDELARNLIMIHNRFTDDPTVNSVTIYFGDDLFTDDDNLDLAWDKTSNKITKIMDTAKAAGFYKISITYIPDDVNSAKTAKIIDKAKKAGYHINILEHNKPVKSNFSAYDLMKDKNFTKDIEKVLKNVKNLEKTAK